MGRYGKSDAQVFRYGNRSKSAYHHRLVIKSIVFLWRLSDVWSAGELIFGDAILSIISSCCDDILNQKGQGLNDFMHCGWS